MLFLVHMEVRLPPDMPAEQAEDLKARERELAQSLRLLGVKEHQFVGLADGGCADADPEPLIEKLAALMTELRPAVSPMRMSVAKMSSISRTSYPSRRA